MRDYETTLDWFNARYFSGAQGRFQSVDPANAGANPADPQTWNGHAYVGNNPLSYTDPSGMVEAAGGGGGIGGFLGGIFGDIGNLFESIFGGGGGSKPTPPPIPFTGPTWSITVTGTNDDITITSPYFPAVVAGVQQAGPTVNLAAAGTAAVSAIPLAASAAMAATGVLARGVGYYYAAAGGTGVVLGRYPDYINAAKLAGANVYSI